MSRSCFPAIRSLLALVSACALSLGALAEPVTEATARLVARNFITSHIALHGGWNGALDPEIASVQLVAYQGQPVVYHVQVQPGGYLLVAYDDDFSPVLLYSDRSSFEPERIDEPDSVAAWILPETHAVYESLRKRAAEIGSPQLLAALKGQTPSGRAWVHFNRPAEQYTPLEVNLDAKSSAPAGKETLAKAGPFVTAAWGQGSTRNAPYLYNLYTPADKDCAHTLTGCVATAAAQLMKYWNWPDSGTGSSSYSWSRPGSGGTQTLSASYAHTYNWSQMPDKLTASSSSAQVDAVARLMADLGIANQMGFGCSGSSSVTERMATVVLPTYFKYRNTVQVVRRTDYSASAFFAAIKAELDANPPRPMLYRMSSTSGAGHAVVVDGYQSGTTNMVHVNMGWDGNNTSYYDISGNWTSGNYTWDYTSQVAFTNIQPDRATSCTYALSGSTLTSGAAAGNGSVSLSTSSACSWTATSNASWITVTSGASGSGSGTVAFSIAANGSTAPRTGTLTIGGQTFTVTQAGTTCSYAISPASQSVGAIAGSGNVSVSTGASCAWTAYSNASWIAVTAGASGSGSGTVVYSVAANTASSARSGTLAIAGQNFTVTQAAASCSYTVVPSSLSVGSGATTGKLNVTALTSCAWSASSNTSWLTVTSGASGSGEGTVSYAVAANTGASARSGTITVGGQSFVLTQSGVVSGAVELANGDFENGHSGWTEAGPYDIITEDYLIARGGFWFAWLSGYDNADDQLYQTVTIPANAQQATLQFWYGIETDELPSGAYDKMSVGVYNRDTGALITRLDGWSNLDAGPNWVQSRAYDLSAFRGQTVYIAFMATSDSSINTNFFVDDVKLTVTTGSTPADTNYTSLWWNPSESGWGINFTHQANTLFATLFTYAADGRPLWLVASNLALQPNGSFSGTLYRTTGPPYYANPWNPSQVGLSTVGTMSVSFSGANAGTLTYTFSGTTVTKSIQRQVFSSPVPTCTLGTGSRSTLTNYQDLWWNAAESGWGMNLTHQGNIIFATLFTYDNTGRDAWLVASALNRQANGSYTGTLYVTGGPAFNASPWQGVTATEVGTMTLQFSSGEAGTLSYTVLGTTVTKSITRQVFGTTVPFCR